MKTQFKIAEELVNDYWGGENFWGWLGMGPMCDAEEEYKETGDITYYIDHLDRCISCIVDNDEDQYSADELEFLNSVEETYKFVDLKFDYTFMNALYNYLLEWCDNEKMLKEFKEQLAIAKLCGVELEVA